MADADGGYHQLSGRAVMEMHMLANEALFVRQRATLAESKALNNEQ